MVSLKAKDTFTKLKGNEQALLEFIQESLEKDIVIKQKEEAYNEAVKLYEKEINELKMDKRLFRCILERDYV